jgi:hypothetical protein
VAIEAAVVATNAAQTRDLSKGEIRMWIPRNVG